MSKLATLRAKLLGYKADPDLVAAYRTVIPSTIDLQITTKGDHYIAVIKSIDKKKLLKEEYLITEATSEDKLITMVNDLIFAYKEIPEAYRPYYKLILQPEKEGKIAPKEHLKLVKAG